MQEILAKLRKYEIKIRKAISTEMRGNYHSIFKGSGLEFSDVRDYLYGDDVRRIDWNVSAKGQGTFVKEFKEEKEQTIFFLLDVSASQQIGQHPKESKLHLAKEICGVLALSAVKENSEVGVICFSDRKEKYIRPQKGVKFAYELILSLFSLQTVSKSTDISQMILYALQIIKRKSVVILISDFIDQNYLHNFKALAQKHDLVVIQIYDPQDITIPKAGIAPLLNPETGQKMWYNTSSSKFQKKLKENFVTNQQLLEQTCQKLNVNYLLLKTNEEYIGQLIQLFRVRNIKRKV